MALWNKKKAEAPAEQPVPENAAASADINVETEENNTMAAAKKYIYLAFDENRNVILDDNMNPVVSKITEEKTKIEWPEDVYKYSRKVMSDTAYRVELPPLPEGISDPKEKKAAKKRQLELAKEELFKLAEDKIAEAKRLKGGTDEETSAAEAPAAEVPAEPKQEHASEDKVRTESSSHDDGDKGGTGDVQKLLEAMEQRINKDLSDSVDDINEENGRNNNELRKDIKKIVTEKAKELDARTKEYTEAAGDSISQKLGKVSEDISGKVNDAESSIGETQDKLVSKVNSVSRKITDLVESVEGIEGNLTRLDQLDEIAELLRDKGVNISREIPPVNAEEEDIINLVRYSQKITEQLGYAARDLLRKSEAFRNQAENNENEQRMMEQRIENARQEGIAEGRLQVIRQLLSKYEDVDTLKDSSEGAVHVIWVLLTELGAEIDGDGLYEKGREIDLSDEDIERMIAVYSKFDGAGRYKVVRTGLSFNGEVVCAAKFSKITEDDGQDTEASGSEAEKPAE